LLKGIFTLSKLKTIFRTIISSDAPGGRLKDNQLRRTSVDRQTKALIRLFAVGLAFLSLSPCNAISLRIDSFELASPDEAARWARLLDLGADAGVRVKSTAVQLRDVTLSITRVETAACIQDVCPTFFKYQLDRTFEFIIPCKEGLVILDMAQRDSSGKYVVSAALAAGGNLTTLVTPTSMGPMITTVKDNLSR
jgi:hypothetical protein